jgi:hypothetical protein
MSYFKPKGKRQFINWISNYYPQDIHKFKAMGIKQLEAIYWRKLREVRPLLILAILFLSSIGNLEAREWEGIVIHHTATPNGKEYSLEQCNRDHRAKNWDMCGYSFLVQPNGDIVTSRGYRKTGAHTKGHNKSWLGVAFVGTGRANQAQLSAFRQKFGEYELLHPHSHFRATLCPGEVHKQIIGNSIPI